MKLLLLLVISGGLSITTHAAAQPSPPPLVVIDAGHGGQDPGAIGGGGLREKDVALDLSLRLYELLQADGFEVRLTRPSDLLVPLHDRAALANEWRQAPGVERPALFVSIHANAHDRGSVRGVETYFLSDALTEDAERLAALENSSLRFEPASADEGLDFILDDLRQNLFLRESSDAASIVQRRLRAIHPGPDRGVKQARFVVLTGVRMPAVLVEVGFLSNPADEAMLRNPEQGARMASELRRAIVDYLGGSALRRSATVD